MARYVISLVTTGEVIAEIDQLVPWQNVCNFALSLSLDPLVGDVDVLDSESGVNYFYTWNNRRPDEVEPYDEPDDIDDDMGFDPYMGCFTGDC